MEVFGNQCCELGDIFLSHFHPVSVGCDAGVLTEGGGVCAPICECFQEIEGVVL